MKKTIVLLLLLSALLLIGANKKGVELTIRNRSGMNIAVSLVGEEKENTFYLRVPEGTKADPSERVFEIPRDTYFMQIYYLEIWDPVYGFVCDGAVAAKVEVPGNLRLSVLPCDQPTRHGGEQGFLKLPALRARRPGR